MDRRLRIHRSSRSSVLDRTPDDVWAVVAGAGPGPHWYDDALPMAFRALVDRAVGGAGRRWPVPDRPRLEQGDTAGFWRVDVCDPRRHHLELVADVRSPGEVRLTSQVTATDEGSRLDQSVSLDPDSLVGQLYMLADLPAREVVIEWLHRRVVADLGAS